LALSSRRRAPRVLHRMARHRGPRREVARLRGEPEVEPERRPPRAGGGSPRRSARGLPPGAEAPQSEPRPEGHLCEHGEFATGPAGGRTGGAAAESHDRHDGSVSRAGRVGARGKGGGDSLSAAAHAGTAGAAGAPSVSAGRYVPAPANRGRTARRHAIESESVPRSAARGLRSLKSEVCDRRSAILFYLPFLNPR